MPLENESNPQTITNQTRQEQKLTLFDLSNDIAKIAKKNSIRKSRARTMLENETYTSDRKTKMMKRMDFLMSPESNKVKPHKLKNLKNTLKSSLGLNRSTKNKIDNENMKKDFEKNLKKARDENIQYRRQLEFLLSKISKDEKLAKECKDTLCGNTLPTNEPFVESDQSDEFFTDFDESTSKSSVNRNKTKESLKNLDKINDNNILQDDNKTCTKSIIDNDDNLTIDQNVLNQENSNLFENEPVNQNEEMSENIDIIDSDKKLTKTKSTSNMNLRSVEKLPENVDEIIEKAKEQALTSNNKTQTTETVEIMDDTNDNIEPTDENTQNQNLERDQKKITNADKNDTQQPAKSIDKNTINKKVDKNPQKSKTNDNTATSKPKNANKNRKFDSLVLNESDESSDDSSDSSSSESDSESDNDTDIVL